MNSGKSFAFLLAALVVMIASSPASATTRTWNGGGGSNTNWSQKKNWGNSSLSAGQALNFAGTVSTSTYNDTTANTSYAGISFSNNAGVFSLNGNAITLTGGVTNNSAHLQTINLAMAIGSSVAINTASNDLLLNGVISGAGSLSLTGSHTTTLAATNTFSGSVSINAGTLSLGANGTLASTNIVVNSGGTLLLGGNNQLASNAALTLGGGTFSLGAGATRAGSNSLGTLTLTANSVIDFSALCGNSVLNFKNIQGLDTYTLSILDWNGTTAWGTTINSGTTTQLIDSSSLTTNQLAHISFYSGNTTSSGFLGNGVFSGNQVIPVPEPALTVTAGLLLGLLALNCLLVLARS